MISSDCCKALQRSAEQAGYHYDESRAQWVADFLKTCLVHSKGKWAGQPFELLDWQWQWIISPLFGWVHRDTGLRRYRMAHIELPKKSGKSTLAAGIGLYMLVGDGEPSPEIYSCATSRDQASIIHNEAIQGVERSPVLADKLRINRTNRNIYCTANHGTYRAASAEAGGLEGINPSCCLIDELHVWKGHGLWETLRWGSAARSQPLTFVITTAGLWDPEAIGWQRHQYAMELIAGAHDDIHTLAVIAAAPDDADWTKPETWRLANPSMDLTIQQAEMAQACAEAQAIPRLETAFRRYRLNQWVASDSKWIDPADWRAIGTASGLPEHAELVFLGLDLAEVDDMVALGYCWLNGDVYHVQSEFWAPAAALQRRAGAATADYVGWSKRGLLKICPGDRLDYDMIRDHIEAQTGRLAVAELAFDPYQCLQLAGQMESLFGLEVVQFQQTARNYNEPARMLEKKAREGGLTHSNHPILNWQIANTRINETSEGHIRPDRVASPDVIPGVRAVLMALARCMLSDHCAPSISLL